MSGWLRGVSLYPGGDTCTFEMSDYDEQSPRWAACGLEYGHEGEHGEWIYT